MGCSAIRIERAEVSAYTVPTDFPESDGTLVWNATTVVVVQVQGGGQMGLGYSYTAPAAAKLIRDHLLNYAIGASAVGVAAPWATMSQAVRNLGWPGIVSAAVAAVDVALWDLKARILELPLVELLGQVRPRVSVYGSGGFTSYSIAQLQEQLAGWVQLGIRDVKMKVGRDPAANPARVQAAREAIGPQVGLMIDANGAYGRKQALEQAEQFARLGVTWFEEPVSSDDVEGLRLLRDRAPAGMEIAAGEYGYQIDDFRRLLEAGAVDVLQVDVTRCGGITGFLQAAALAQAYHVPLSGHTAPTLHGHLGCVVAPMRNVEYFHDHARVETALFDGALTPVDGVLQPDLTRPGLGLEFKRSDAQQWAS